MSTVRRYLVGHEHVGCGCGHYKPVASGRTWSGIVRASEDDDVGGSLSY